MKKLLYLLGFRNTENKKCLMINHGSIQILSLLCSPYIDNNQCTEKKIFLALTAQNKGQYLNSSFFKIIYPYSLYRLLLNIIQSWI